MSPAIYIIPPVWLASGFLTAWLAKWLADDSEIPFVPNMMVSFVFGPVFFPILLYYFVKRQLFYRAILLYVRLLEAKSSLRRAWIKLRIKMRKK